MKTKNAKTPKAGRGHLGSAASLGLKSILVPLDLSTPSRKALDYAVTFARQFKAKLTLVHVVEPVATPDFPAAFPMVMEPTEIMTHATKRVEASIKAARIPRGIVEKVLVRFGRSFHEITEVARKRKSDLIIISTHGYTGLTRVLLGSTAESVVRHAPCPVLVLRHR